MSLHSRKGPVVVWSFLCAIASGYFFLDRCPNCGRYFSDDEQGNTLMYDSKYGLDTCSRPACMHEVTEKNKATALHQGWWWPEWGEKPANRCKPLNTR